MSATENRLLAVDDDPEVLYYLRRILEPAGYSLSSAGSAAEARHRLAERSFAVVLTDLRLPAGVSGLDVLQEARRSNPLSVGIVLTGHGSAESALEALREGAYDYLLKPCPPDALLAAVRRALEYYRLKSDLVAKTAELDGLRKQLNQKSAVIANVSHELKNPLSVVYGYSSFLLAQAPHEHKPEDLKRSLESIHNNAQKLGHLLEELVESSRLTNHKIELERREVSAALLAREVVESFRIEAQHRGLSLAAKEPLAEDLVSADARRVQQVLSNLLTNALKFTPAGGKIAVSAAREEKFVRFGVEDTGVGLSQEDLSRVFERFYQAESTRRTQPGLGLGLDISRGLIELHGGRIWAEGAPSLGARFYFTLPLAA